MDIIKDTDPSESLGAKYERKQAKKKGEEAVRKPEKVESIIIEGASDEEKD
jgi:hypothetical protein